MQLYTLPDPCIRVTVRGVIFILLILVHTICCDTRLYFVHTVVSEVNKHACIKTKYEKYQNQSVNSHTNSHFIWYLTLSGSFFFKHVFNITFFAATEQVQGAWSWATAINSFNRWLRAELWKHCSKHVRFPSLIYQTRNIPQIYYIFF